MKKSERVEDVYYVHKGTQNTTFNYNYWSNQGGDGYSNNRNHPNMTYGNQNNALTPPPGFSVSKGGAVKESMSAGVVQEDFLRAILASSDTYIAEQADTSKRVTRLEQVVGMGVYPSQSTENLKECKAIHLRSETTYQGPPMATDGRKKLEHQEEEEDEDQVVIEEIVVEEREKPKEVQPEPPMTTALPEVKVPYPYRLKKHKENE